MVAQRETLFRLLAANPEIGDIMDGAGSLSNKHYAFPIGGFTASRAPICNPDGCDKHEVSTTLAERISR